MSTILDADKIDLVTKASNGDVKLIMVEVRPWAEVSMTEIQNKFHTYLDYIEGGHLVGQYPEAKGSKVIIRLDAVEPPSTEVSSFLNVVLQKWLSPINIDLEIGDLTQS